MYRLIAALLAASSCAAAAQAQIAPSAEAAAPTLTLDRALDLAGAASPSLDAAAAEVRVAEASRRVAALRPNPSIAVEAENIAGTGVYRGVDELETTASLSLPLELGGKRSARIAVADARSGRAVIDAATAAADLRLAVIQTYAEAVAADRRLEAARDQARIAADSLRVARVRVEAGRASPIEVERAGLVRINADVAADRAARLAEVARSALGRLIGQPVTASLDLGWFSMVSSRYGPPAGVDGRATLAMAAADADLSIADAGVRLARSQRIPDVTANIGARRMEATNDTAALIGVSIPIPLFNNGRAALSLANAERQRAAARQRMTVLELEQAVSRAEADAANAAATASAASGPALTTAQEAARIARIGYREGRFGQLDLLEAERALSETRIASIDALLAYHIAQAQLERLIAPAPANQDY